MKENNKVVKYSLEIIIYNINDVTDNLKDF